MTTATNDPLDALNRTDSDIPEVRVEVLFAEVVRRIPDGIALEGSERVTYAELDRRAEAIADRLAAAGVRADDLVGVCMPRSPDLVACLLATWKCGAAYVPVDPALPDARLEYLLGDARPRIVIADAASARRLPSGISILDAEDRETVPRRAPHGAGPDHLAYVLYTSGSTGRPKGVMIHHRGLVNYLLWACSSYEVESGTGSPVHSPLAFDLTVTSLFTPLLAGRTAELVPDDPGGLGLIESVRKAPPGARLLLKLTPAHLDVLFHHLGAAEVGARVRAFVVGGEQLLGTSLRSLRAEAPGARVFNEYGPTETVVGCCVQEVDASVDLTGAVPIGWPIANTRLYILDERLNPVPLGQPGELYIGGLGVARGYLRRPELTAERFVPDPFSPRPGARLYRTGDRCVHLPDGRLSFLGRNDDQVKVRGYRIELGEIEAALRELPGVREAAAVVRDTAGHKRIIAFVMAGPDITPQTLRVGVATKLPEYMIPSIVLVEQLPLTINAKVDRAALVAMPLPADVVTQGPRNELERRLSAIWSEVLGTDAVDVFASFFEIGGDSLRAAMVTNRLEEVLGETIYVVAIFDHPTIADLAEYLEFQYANAVARMTGRDVGKVKPIEPPLTAASLDLVRTAIEQLAPARAHSTRAEAPAPRNPRAVFVLSPPRSGSTLFRVMLAGNPALFAPQELNLLEHDHLGTSSVLPNGHEWIAEGTIRTLMEIYGWNVEQAKAQIAKYEATHQATRDVFRDIQTRVAPKVLVDKTTTYALSRTTLERAERTFERPFYIFLLRHPCGMIRSFVKARMDQFFIRWSGQAPVGPERLGEALWMICNQNIMTFLDTVPAERKCVMRYEEVVRDPIGTMRALCDRLEIPFDDGMARPHSDGESKMIDGIYGAASRQIGDVNFNKHSGIDASVADAWKSELDMSALGEITRDLAAKLGY